MRTLGARSWSIEMLTARENVALRLLVTVVLATIVAANVASAATTQRIFDNVHWTISYATGAWLAWIGAARSGDADVRPRRYLAAALTTYAGGQVLWDVQVATGWNPFPGPSDLLYLWLGPLSGLGLIGFLHRNTSGAQRRLIALDVAGLTIAVLALTLALYLPRRGELELLPLSFLVAYPVALCWAASVGVISALTLQLAPRRGWLLCLGALLVNAMLWLRWNSLTLDNALSDGTPFNALFSLAAIAQGLGALWWRAEVSVSERWARVCHAVLRLLPLAIVCVAALSAVIAHTLSAVPMVVQWTAWIGGALVVLIASLRQSVLISEHEDLIRVERGLRQNETVYRVLFDQATDGIFIADKNGRYIDVNPRGADLLAATREHVLSLNISDIVAVQDQGRVPSEIADLLAGRTVSRTWHLRRKDGSVFPAEVSAKMLTDGRLIGVARDISERIALEGQLRQAQKMEAIGTLAAGVAHDFNNLIAAMVGNTEVASRRIGSAHAAQSSLKEIHAACARATELVRQIVAFSRPREPAMQMVSLGKVVEEVTRLLRSTLPAGVELKVAVSPEAPAVLGDPSQVHQVLVNLATNSWQAMEGRPGSISLSVDEQVLGIDNSANLPPGRYACVVVRDTGKGMDARTTERIFEPFFTTKKVGEGTGLGLAIVHSIVHTHGGAITVESALGVGTSFRILLPAAQGAARSEEATPSRAPGALRTGVRVVYVDDEPALVSLMSQHLKHEGCDVSTFQSSEAALEALRQAPNSFDVLITDYNMPKLSGLELVRELGALRPDRPFVLTSGSVEPNLEERAAALGVRVVLQKPYALNELVRVVGEVAPTQHAEASAVVH